MVPPLAERGLASDVDFSDRLFTTRNDFSQLLDGTMDRQMDEWTDGRPSSVCPLL